MDLEAMTQSIERTVTFTNDDGERQQIAAGNLLSMPRSVVLLGEPGMGKTWLLEAFEQQPNMVMRSAASFVKYPTPAKLVSKGSTLIIDGLDELLANNESDPLNQVLGKLVEADHPRFILSCRAADWRSVVATRDIAREYGDLPIEATLDPLTRDAALAFLAEGLPTQRAVDVISYLDDKGLSDLYGNPLTLRLFASLAKEGQELPVTRADLYQRACEVMWRERSDVHDRSALASLDQEAALTSAGAACAAIILTGAQSIATRPSLLTLDASQPINVADVSTLPGGTACLAILTSRLFRAGESVGEFRPIHRTVAEYLGARWLAKVATTDQMRERVLALLTFDDGVPASLRGIHAWLAHFDKKLAPSVIDIDPYGLLRYGDAEGLSIDEGRRLLVSLQRLQAANPYFRAEDWTRHSVGGIARPELYQDLRSILFANDANFHLRSLVLEAIRGTEVATQFVADLRIIALGEGEKTFNFSDRDDAVDALIGPPDSGTDWSQMVDALVDKGGDDDTRLALKIIGAIGAERFTPIAIAQTILAHLGLLPNSGNRPFRGGRTGSLYHLGCSLPDSMIPSVLDALAREIRVVEQYSFDSRRSELADFVARLMRRQLEIASPAPRRLLKWLKIVPQHFAHRSDDQKRLAQLVGAADDVRRELQRHIIYHSNGGNVWERIWRLRDVYPPLALTQEDVIYFLRKLGAKRKVTEPDIAVWRELASSSRGYESWRDEILPAAAPLAKNRPELEAYLETLTQPLQPAQWQLDQEMARKKEQAALQKSQNRDRRTFADNEAAVRAGELRFSIYVAQLYLGHFIDGDSTPPPHERVVDWFGLELREAVFAGLEAALAQPEILAPEDFARDYAAGRSWNLIDPIIAAVAERVRTGRELSDLTDDVIVTARLALIHEHTGDVLGDGPIADKLEQELDRRTGQYERFMRLLIEPHLQSGQAYIPGLHLLTGAARHRALAHRLCVEWLTSYSDLPISVEEALVDVLADEGDAESIGRISDNRANLGYRDDQHRRNWEASDLVFNFGQAVARIGTVSSDEKNLLWHLRDRLGGDRFSGKGRRELGPHQAAWIISQFRKLWPDIIRPVGVTSGDTNAWDASGFLGALIDNLASDLSDTAAEELSKLAETPGEYAARLRYAHYQQRRARREANFPGVTISGLKSVLEGRAPESVHDLLVVVSNGLRRLQQELRGSNTDPIKKYWTDNDQPRPETYCTDRLIEDIQRILPSEYGIASTPEYDMPAGKTADIVFSVGTLGLPVECKGQWHRDLWAAAKSQLDKLYTGASHAQGFGLYIAYWFGTDVDASHRLKADPDGGPAPQTPDELRTRLINKLPATDRGRIQIEVLDLSRPAAAARGSQRKIG